VSLRQAVAWLGFDEVANIAFTAALQGKMLDVPGQHQAARRLWRHALASAIWSKRLAKKLGQNPAEIYMCGLLHNIGKPVTLVAAHDLARRAKSKLSAEEYARLIETFHRPIGSRVVGTWNLPPCVSSVVSHWETYQGSPAARLECHIVNVAHRLADYTLEDTNPLARDLLIVDPAFAELGFSVSDGAQLFESAAAVSAQMDRYLAP
jgi:HD-like signal output (HDOD) protein